MHPSPLPSPSRGEGRMFGEITASFDKLRTRNDPIPLRATGQAAFGIDDRDGNLIQ
jgi:hypothetical protein